MRVADRLTQREASWHELEQLVDRMLRRHPGRPLPADVLRLGELYRGACTDLMLGPSLTTYPATRWPISTAL